MAAMPVTSSYGHDRPEHLVLVHSPIVGPDTFEPIAEVARSRGHSVIVPALRDTGVRPFWQAHTDEVLAALSHLTPSRVTVVAHSGAGQLMAYIGTALEGVGHAIDAYLLLDAGLPTGGASRLDQLEDEDGPFSERVRAVLQTAGGFPDWTDEQLEPTVPDRLLRRRLLDGVQRLPLEYWTEPMPVRTPWPADTPCGVVLTSGGYETSANAAADNGWPLRRVGRDNHFRLITEPQVVAAALLDLRDELLSG